MILTTHILSGTALGANIENSYVVAGLSIFLHFILDLFPHGDYINKKSHFSECWKGIVDMTFGISLVILIIISEKNSFSNAILFNIGTGIVFSLLPDFTTFLYLFLKMRFLSPIYKLHQKLHLLYYQDFAPEREFGLRNNFWDIFFSIAALTILLKI